LLGALVGPVWSPRPGAPDPTLPTAVWPCLLPARHSHHRDRGDSRRSGDRSGWWCGGCGLGAQCDVRPVDPTGRAPLSGRRFAGALVTVRRLDGAAPEGNSKAVGDALGKPPSMAKHLSDGPLVCVGFWLPQTALIRPLRLPSGSEAVRLAGLRVSALFSTVRSLPYHASDVRLL
jgi:hypothetical protein